jgi:hypothetical protein
MCLQNEKVKGKEIITEMNISGEANMEIEFCLMRRNTSLIHVYLILNLEALYLISKKILVLMCKVCKLNIKHEFMLM